MLGSGTSQVCHATTTQLHLTLSRSASPAQSESPHVNTEPTGARVAASRLSVVGRTVMIPGFPRRCRKTDWIFLMSVSLARPRVDEAFPIAQYRSARSTHNNYPTSCRYTRCSLAGISFSSVSRRSHPSVGEHLSADMWNSNFEVVRLLSLPRVNPSSALVLSSPRYLSSTSRLSSARTSLMIWCVPANNRSST